MYSKYKQVYFHYDTLLKCFGELSQQILYILNIFIQKKKKSGESLKSPKIDLNRFRQDKRFLDQNSTANRNKVVPDLKKFSFYLKIAF